MNITTRYLLRQLGTATFFVTFILTGAVWLTQSLRFIEVFITRGLPLSTFFKLLLFLLPDLIGIILPVGLLIGILFVYNRCYVDYELIIMRSMGVNNFQLARPAILLALFVMTLLYTINLYFLPVAFQKFRDLEFEIRNSISGYMVQPGEFNAFKNITVYVRNRKKNGVLRGVFIHDARDPQKTFTVMAEQGLMKDTPLGLKVTLENGHRQEINSKTQKPSILSFDQYTIDLSTKQGGLKKRQKKPYERFVGELLSAEGAENSSSAHKFRVEAHQRLAMPLTTLVFTLIALAIFLGGDENRRGRTKRIISIAVACGGLEILTLVLLHAGERLPITFPLTYSLLFVLSALAFFALVRDKKMLKRATK